MNKRMSIGEQVRRYNATKHAMNEWQRRRALADIEARENASKWADDESDTYSAHPARRES